MVYYIERDGVWIAFPQYLRIMKNRTKTKVVYVKIVTNIKNVSEVNVGDTITVINDESKVALPGYKTIKPMVFCGMYPIDSRDFEDFRTSLEKLKLNDASLTFEPNTSTALGFGFRCGFLGMLHMEIVQERLEREYGLDLITSAPTVIYEVVTKGGDVIRERAFAA